MSSKPSQRQPYSKATWGKTDLIRVCLLARPRTTDATLRTVVSLVFGSDVSAEMVAVIKNRLRKKGMSFPDGRITKKRQ